VYLWNIYIPVALPVIAITGLATLAYISTAVLPLVFDFCPYTTASSKLVGLWLKGAYIYVSLQYDAIEARVFFHYDNPWQRTNRSINWTWLRQTREYIESSVVGAGAYVKPLLSRLSLYLMQHFIRVRTGACATTVTEDQISSLSPVCPPFADPKTLMMNGEVPMDLVTSEMVAWLLANCEDPKLMNITVQSLGGAQFWLPRLPLLENGAIRHIFQYLEGCFELDSISDGALCLKTMASPDSASLYHRALNFILTYHNYEGFYLRLSQGEGYTYKNTWAKTFDTGFSDLVSRRFYRSPWYAFLQLTYWHQNT
jgi:hypothetical protein